MRFVPDYRREALSETQYAERIAQIGAMLEPCTERGFWTAADGCRLYRVFSRAENARASVVLVHGFTEFSEKLTELRWLLLRQGYNVLCYDARGHGLSDRSVDDLQLTHVERFSDYTDDLDGLLRTFLLPRTEGLPVYLYGHSMGGCVAALWLKRGADLVARAVLSSPMLCPVTYGLPRRVLRAMVRKGARDNGWAARFPFTGGFNPNPDFRLAGDASFARFRHNMELRLAEPRYQNSSASYRWMDEALTVQDRLLAHGAPEAIRAQVLLVSAGADHVVRRAPQRRLAKRIPQCRFVSLRGAKHCLYTSAEPLLGRYFDLVLDFLAQGCK